MSYTLEPRRLKKLIDYYSPNNNCQQIKFLKVFDGQQGLLRHLETSPFQGIDQTSIQERITQFGSNQQFCSATKQHKKYFQVLLSEFARLPAKIQIIFSIITLILGIIYSNQHIEYPWVEGVAFILIFLIIYAVKIMPEIYMEQQNSVIKQVKEFIPDCVVWRDNQKHLISAQLLVVGDIVELQQGSAIGADGLIIQGQITVKQKLGHLERQAIKMVKKESIQNFKAIASKKKFMAHSDVPDRASPIIIGGSTVLKGTGRMIILCVGKYSQKGYKQMLIDQSCQRKVSRTQQKVQNLIFQCSKDMVLVIILLVILYCAKNAILIMVKQSLQSTDWLLIVKDLLHCLPLILSGVPYFLNIGLAIGLLHIKLSIWREHQIYYKYSRDCDKIGNISTILYEENNDRKCYQFKGWWNVQFQEANYFQIRNQSFSHIFYESLKAEDFDPYQFGLQFPSFYIGISERQITFLQKALTDFAAQNQRKQTQKQLEVSLIQIQQQSSSNEGNFKNKYFKGSAETMLTYCTHMLNKYTGEIQLISEQRKQQMQKLIWKINQRNSISLLSGYIQVNSNHPRFREGNSRIIFVSILNFSIHEDIKQFEAFFSIKKKQYNFLLISNKDQEQIVAKGREIGIISAGKPCINLKGYDLINIIGGVLCKFCKNAICSCTQYKQTQYILKNQDQFASIQKHICTLSQANMLQKLTVVIGYMNSGTGRACIFGSTIQDIPSMKASQLSFFVRNGSHDLYAEMAAQVILKQGKLAELDYLITWSAFTFLFYKKYTIFFLTPCLVAFASNCFGFLFFDTEAIKLIQCLWLLVIISPLLGLTYSFSGSSIPKDQYQQQLQQGAHFNANTTTSPSIIKNEDNMLNLKSLKQSQILDKSNYRHVVSQVVFQTTILLFIFLFGQNLIPESVDDVDNIIGDNWSAKYANQLKNTVCWGVRRNIFTLGKDVYENTFLQYHIYSRHFTFIFNLFVLFQFMNFLLTRVCHKPSLNIFEGMNLQTSIVVLFTITIHCVLVQFGGEFMGLYPYGLTLIQWSMTFGFSMLTCILGILIKQIPINEDKEGDRKYRVWPNKAYNLAVMAIAPRQDLIDFKIDEDFAFQERIKQGHNE